MYDEEKQEQTHVVVRLPIKGARVLLKVIRIIAIIPDSLSPKDRTDLQNAATAIEERLKHD